MEILPNWHPFFVHFSIGLWTTAVALYLVTLFLSATNARGALLTVARWNLWLGTSVSIFTVAAGVYAYNTVTHDTPSHAVMNEHRLLALLTFGGFVMLSFGAWYRLRAREGHPGLVFTALIVGAAVLLMDTGWHGAELVYRHGLGVRSLPQHEGAANTSGNPGKIDESQPHQHSDGHAHEHDHED